MAMQHAPSSNYPQDNSRRHYHLLVTSSRGFTIVELLIVIMVIAILAVITIVSYSGITKQTVEAVMKGDLRTAATKLELMMQNDGNYPSDGSLLTSSGDNELSYSLTDGAFCLSVTNPRSNKTLRLKSSGQVEEGACATSTTMVAAGYGHTCAIAGQAYCWGQNTNGQLGDGTTTQRTTPVAVNTSGVLAGKTVTAISAGNNHTCVIASGQAYCWGQNTNGQLGDGTTTQRSVPVAVNTSGVLAGKTVTAIVTSHTDAHTCALADSLVYCWGINTYGQLGDGTTTQRSVPVAVNTSGVLAGKTVTAIAAGGDHTCAISDSQAYCWGLNLYRQLGDGTTTNRTSPVATLTTGVLSGKSITSITGGANYTCAVGSSQAYCWGQNIYGQLGDGTTTQRSVPVAVNTSGVLLGKSIQLVLAGSGHACAVSENQAYCWGLNGYGQLGDGTTTQRLQPVAVNSLDLITGNAGAKYVTGNGHICTIASHQVYCWGLNSTGQMGDGTTTNRSIPAALPTLP